MASALIVPCLLLIIYGEISAENWNKTVFVSPRGNDNRECGNQTYPCQSLNFVFIYSGICFNSTRIKLESGLYSLNRTYNFSWLHHFALVGKDGSPEEVIIDCSPNASLSFVLSERIVLEDFTLQSCGGWHLSTRKVNVTTHRFVKFQTSLYLNYCNDIKMSRVHVVKSHGLAINFYDIGGMLNLEDCVLMDNVPGQIGNTQSEDYAIAGGGIFLELTEEGSNPLSHPDKQHTLQISNNLYSITRCQFFRNKTPRPNESSFLKLSFINGGGLGIRVENEARNNEFNVRYCEFTGNEAGWGGAIHGFMSSCSLNNSMNITNTTFEGNRATVSGGGVRFSQSGSVALTKSETLNRAFFDNCTFSNNTAFWGGGTSVFGATQHFTPTGSNKTVYFRHCRWIGNYGTMGSAVAAFLNNLNENSVGPLVPYSVIFEDCLVVGNKLQPPPINEGYTYTVGLGAIFTIQVPLTLVGNTTISDNDHTSLALDSANVGIYGRTIFRNNTGYKGGAIALYGRSTIVLFEDSELYFIKNHCQTRGGAMYITAQGSPFTRLYLASSLNLHPCFFLYKNHNVDFKYWKTKIVFRGNTASSKSSGNSVFASTLGNCRQPGEHLINNSVLHWPFVTFLDINGNKTDVASEVSTEPVDIVFDSKEWRRAPGERFTATLKLFDELWNPGNGVVQVSVEAKRKSQYVNLATSPLFLVENGHLNNVKIDGKENVQFKVELMTVGGPLVKRNIHNASLLKCYPGFHASGDICVCDSQPGIVGCGKNGSNVYIRNGYWAGFVGKEFVTSPCPDNYCAECANPTNRSLPKGTCRLYQKNKMCAKNRIGSSILCGKCQRGYSVELGSLICSECSNFYLLLIIPYGITLLILVMAIMAINLDAFTGYLNAWLYSYQVMSLLKKNEVQFDPFLNFIIGLGELQIKLPNMGVCFAENLNMEDVLMTMYIVPTYVLLLVFILAKVVRRYPDWAYSKKVRAPFRALCTIFVLCYTTISGISLKMLHFVHVGDKFVLYQDGELEFFKNTKHILYGTAAIVYIVAVVIPVPLFLMFTPFFVRKTNQYLHINLNKFKPIYDTLQSCFKDEYRWFSAFYFISRLLLLILATFVQLESLKRCLIEITCIIVLALFLYFRPYKQAKTTDRREQQEEDFDWINKSDAVLLTNLCLIAVISSSLDGEMAEKVVDGLGYVPLIVLMSVLYRVIRKRFPFIMLLPTKDKDSEESSDINENSNI